VTLTTHLPLVSEAKKVLTNCTVIPVDFLRGVIRLQRELRVSTRGMAC
jgi:hypothetical protein